MGRLSAVTRWALVHVYSFQWWVLCTRSHSCVPVHEGRYRIEGDKLLCAFVSCLMYCAVCRSSHTSLSSSVMRESEGEAPRTTPGQGTSEGFHIKDYNQPVSPIDLPPLAHPASGHPSTSISSTNSSSSSSSNSSHLVPQKTS